MSKMSKAQREVMRCAKQYADAMIDLSWKGAQHPDDHATIDANAKVAKINLETIIRKHVAGEPA